AVVAAPGAYGILRAGDRHDPLEHRTVVVIEPAHQARIDLVAHTHGAQPVAQRVEVRARFGIQVLAEERRARDDLLHLGVLAVEHPQRVDGEAPAAVGVEARLVRVQVLDAPLAGGAPALRRAEGADLTPPARRDPA